MDHDLKFPAISDLRQRARKRIPNFAFEYLDSATGTELGLVRNREALDAILFMPSVLNGQTDPDFQTEFMGDTYSLPIGMAPVGMSGMVWPGAERKLASAAFKKRVPFCLSTVAAALPEDVGPHAGDMGWFQLYPPADPEIRRDMLKRAKNAGFRKLVITLDVPGESRRERQRRAAISMPPKLTPGMILSMVLHPVWSLLMAIEGPPSVKLPESYVDRSKGKAHAFTHAGRIIRGYPDWDYFSALRDEWEGDLIAKGVTDPEEATRLRERGADAIWVSNHSARQFEAGPASIDLLPPIRAAVGDDCPVIFDSGVSCGLDVMRALALGADMVFMARAFHYALAALGEPGIPHLFHILEEDIKANMAQIGAGTLADIKEHLI